ncbi:MAG: Gfo/Idh/MocA family oxidoreductase [Lentisphaerae bacterium]|nr:Gfo/Idh/MocA family oxidoreductase [Lentisphaerota bacterium]
MSDKIKVGIVGLSMGRHHLERMLLDSRVNVSALCDTDELRLKNTAEKYGIKSGYTDFAGMLRSESLDAVVIAVPNKFHAPYTLAALDAGLHEFCEKPMAMNTREAEKMQAKAEEKKRNLMINFSFRFMDMSYVLKQQVDAGVVGDIYFGRSVWHRRRGIPGFGGWFGIKSLSGGGPLIDLGVHRLDLALWLMGYPEPESVSGSTYNTIAKAAAKSAKKQFDVEDLACGFIKFTNGATLILEASWAGNIKENDLIITRLLGTKGGILQKNINGGGAFEAEVFTEEGGNLFTKKLDKAVVSAPTSQREFIDNIVEKREPMATAGQGVKVMKILDGIYKSALTGREVRFRKK